MLSTTPSTATPSERRLSREEMLRRWQEERRNDRSKPSATNNRKKSTVSMPLPPPPPPPPSDITNKNNNQNNNIKRVKVRVRPSSTSNTIPTSDRLYKQGTVASRLKSKPPVPAERKSLPNSFPGHSLRVPPATPSSMTILVESQPRGSLSPLSCAVPSPKTDRFPRRYSSISFMDPIRMDSMDKENRAYLDDNDDDQSFIGIILPPRMDCSTPLVTTTPLGEAVFSESFANSNRRHSFHPVYHTDDMDPSDSPTVSPQKSRSSRMLDDDEPSSQPTQLPHDEDSNSFDWRKNFSPEFSMPSIPKRKRRQDASLLLLPQPTPPNNQATPSQESCPRPDTDQYQYQHQQTTPLQQISLELGTPDDDDTSFPSPNFVSDRKTRRRESIICMEDSLSQASEDLIMEHLEEGRISLDDLSLPRSTTSNSAIDDDPLEHDTDDASGIQEEHQEEEMEAQDLTQEPEKESEPIVFSELASTILEQSVLLPIPEHRDAVAFDEANLPTTSTGTACPTACASCQAQKLQLQELYSNWMEQQQCAQETERRNQKLQNQLYAIRKNYEGRVTPFRDIFEELVSLRERNKKLVLENKQTSETLQSTVAELQRQMTEALTIALNKNAALEQKLKDSEDRVAELLEEDDDSEE